jgi:hypothetical protein
VMVLAALGRLAALLVLVTVFPETYVIVWRWLCSTLLPRRLSSVLDIQNSKVVRSACVGNAPSIFDDLVTVRANEFKGGKLAKSLVNRNA